MPRYIEKVEKVSLPVLPTRGLIVYPSIPVNFEVERDFSLKALENAADSDMYVFMVCQKDVNVDSPSASDFYTNGTVCKIKQTVKTPSGNTRVIAEGMCRGSAISYTEKDGCIFAEIMTKAVSMASDELNIRTEALMREAIVALEKISKLMPNESTDIILTAKSIKNPGQAADFIASAALVKYQDKQRILDIYEPIERLETLIFVIESEIKLLKTELSIHKKVREAIDENQKDYYLREQLKVIQSELGNDLGDDIDEYYAKIDDADLPKEVKDKLYKETARLSKTPVGSPEANVLRNYLDICLELPYGKFTEDTTSLSNARFILERDHYGLKKPKERILEYLAVKQYAPDIRHQVLCFVGPPGVGKTSLGQSIADSMGRKFVRVSLGGIRDEAEIRGHRKTYVAAMPGRIIAALSQAGSANPVILLDEIDKLCSDMRGDPASALLEVLDGEQNKNFRDHFIEMPFDLSNVMFIATANTLDTIPRPLLDRMEVIELSTYTKSEKLNIAKNHLLPKQLKRHGLTKSKVRISDEVIGLIIDGYTRESGVRNLERELATICRKAVMKMIEADKASITVSKNTLSEYLGPVKFMDDKVDSVNEIGVVNGLAYTSVGGDVLKIEAAIMEGSGKIELTGTLGDVMKESAHIAVSYIRAHASELGIAADFMKNHDLHIHVPEGATPKDGPSAGVTMLSTLVSLLTSTPARSDTAMTGEITLTGRVLPIGGLKEKATAAWNMGIKRVIIPEKNMVDINELDVEVKSSLTFIPCKTVDQVLREILVTKKSEKKSEKVIEGSSVVHIPSSKKSHNSITAKNKDN